MGLVSIIRENGITLTFSKFAPILWFGTTLAATLLLVYSGLEQPRNKFEGYKNDFAYNGFSFFIYQNNTKIEIPREWGYSPAFNPENNLLAYACDVGKGTEVIEEICLFSKDKGREQLTDNSNYDWKPVWLTESSVLLISTNYVSQTSKVCELSIMAQKAAEFTRCTVEIPHITNIELSETKESIIAVSYENIINPAYYTSPNQPYSTNKYNLYVINTADFSIKQITSNGENLDPHFSPDGQKIVYHSGKQGDRDIYEYQLNSGNIVRLTNQSFHDLVSPVWSPDGKYIAFGAKKDSPWDNWDIYITDASFSITLPLKIYKFKTLLYINSLKWQNSEIYALAIVYPNYFTNNPDTTDLFEINPFYRNGESPLISDETETTSVFSKAIDG